MRILYDCNNPYHKTPFGCLRQKEWCTLRINIPKHCKTHRLSLVIEHDRNHKILTFPFSKTEENTLYECYELTFQLHIRGIYFYHFDILTTDNTTFSLFRHGLRDTNIGQGAKWQLTCFHRNYQNSADFRGKVMYQIFPDRFYQSGQPDLSEKLQPFVLHQNKEDCPEFRPDEHGIIQNNDFFGGNLQGIIRKIPYLAALGVGILYLNPIFLAYSNHRYDTADYHRIDPMLGTERDLQELCRTAHQNGMKILLDAAFSHTGSNSIYFDKQNIFGGGAYHSKHSVYRSWYQFSPNNQYTSWWGIDTLPCVEELNEHFLDFIIRDKDSVVAHWMNLGVDGFRLDVADELPGEFIRLLHRRVHAEKENALVLGEVWEDASNKEAYGVRRQYFVNRELDATMNYPYKDAIIGFLTHHISAESLAYTVMSIADHYPKPVLDCLMNSLTTHDTMRILTVLGGADTDMSREEKSTYILNEQQLSLGICRLKAAMFLQFFLPGCPCIYYGDEVGAQGFEDPFNRGFFPWNNQNEELLDYTKLLSNIKRTHRAVATGTIQVLQEHDGVFTFMRKKKGENMIGVVSIKEQHQLLTNYKPLVLSNGEVRDSHILLHQYGCVLLSVHEPSTEKEGH